MKLNSQAVYETHINGKPHKRNAALSKGDLTGLAV
jgi:hypothetical protein